CDSLRAERLELVAEPLERMAAHVEAERFFFERELLRLGPWRHVRQRNGCRRLVVLRQVEEGNHAFLAIALMTAAVLDRFVDRREQPGASGWDRPVRQVVERAGLDQTFNRTLVDEALIDFFAQREERIDAAAR